MPKETGHYTPDEFRDLAFESLYPTIVQKLRTEENLTLRDLFLQLFTGGFNSGMIYYDREILPERLEKNGGSGRQLHSQRTPQTMPLLSKENRRLETARPHRNGTSQQSRMDRRSNDHETRANG